VPFTAGAETGERHVDLTLPSLKYWDMVLLSGKAAAKGGI
jgi:hypothetical protein